MVNKRNSTRNFGNVNWQPTDGCIISTHRRDWAVEGQVVKLWYVTKSAWMALVKNKGPGGPLAQTELWDVQKMELNTGHKPNNSKSIDQVTDCR